MGGGPGSTLVQLTGCREKSGARCEPYWCHGLCANYVHGYGVRESRVSRENVVDKARRFGAWWTHNGGTSVSYSADEVR